MENSAPGIHRTARGTFMELPPQTRMLLESEGSTTILLESLIACRLTVRVDSQLPVDAGSLDRRIRDELGLSPHAKPVLRRSALLTPAGEVVSSNRVVFDGSAVPWLADSQDSTPLGRELRARNSMQHRVILDNGLASWPPGGAGTPCAFKEYIINCSDGSRIHLHETFSPHFVPVPGR
ncbi:hypothetical protein [Streptomyces sp. RKAG337]|uniref:hypothetical protein n=1 Tax=Streptomyces sp. RKAG337 TaxID=2893404 RepID=UPI002034891C|nr:hypothetical protein [Streptomyces sp. RKAG337]MCM2425608.1 hypothetical protein [Streptomyces sp. RKAG337]